MTMKEAVASAFAKYATFSGRARRSEFWYFYLFNAIVGTVLSSLIVGFADSNLSAVFSGISSLYALVVFIPTLALYWRRLHDIGKGGGSYFICLIPVVGGIILLVWLCRDSEPDSQKHRYQQNRTVLKFLTHF